MSEKTQILIVEDDEAIRFGTRLRLEMHNYGVRTAVDGIDGLKQIREHHPDVVIMDIRMPNMDGLEALAEMKLDPAICKIPVIIASASLGDKVAALDTGAKYFLAKPYMNSVLIAAIESTV